MTKKQLKRLDELHSKGSWKYEELNELDSLYKLFYVHVTFRANAGHHIKNTLSHT